MTSPEHVRTVPTLRSFDERKAKEFYRDYLGFAVDWEHRFAPEMPLFMQVSLGAIVLWISEHHGDASPGAKVTIEVSGLRAFHAALAAKAYGYARPGLEPFIGGGIEMQVSDPFGNRLSFVERANASTSAPRRSRLQAISPFFIVRDVMQSIAFYRDKLGFQLSFLNSQEDPFFAIVKRDGAQLLLKAPEENVEPLPNSKRHPWVRWDAFVDTEDPDALMAEWRGHGLSLHVPAENVDDGLRGFQVSDPDGYVIYFGCPT